MTNTQLSKELAAVGQRISAEVIRKDWAKGAPRNSADAYLAWRAKRAAATSRGDPMLRQLRADKLKQEIGVLKERKTRDRRENAEAIDELISRAWVAERIHAMAGRIDQYRHTSESQHPLLFAAAEGDVAKCREVVMKIWDEILGAMNSFAGEFNEDAHAGSSNPDHGKTKTQPTQ